MIIPMNKKRRNKMSFDSTAANVLSYNPKNSSIYEKLIPGKIKANANGMPININEKGFSKELSIFIASVNVSISEAIKIPDANEITLPAVGLICSEVKQNMITLIIEIMIKVYFEIVGN